jgi:hypothetical protein
MFDLNDAEPQRSGELIPDGTFAKVRLQFRRGGIDGASEIDRGLLKAAKSSDALMLDCEITVIEGPHANQKLWHMYTVQGGKPDKDGTPMAWKITKSALRAMIDSACGLDPNDMSDAARGKRVLRGLADLDNITFVAKIKVEVANDPNFSDQNRIDRVVVPTEPEWRKVMDGEHVPPAPSTRRAAKGAAPVAAAQPAWGQQGTAAQPAAKAAGAPAWANSSAPAATSKPPAAAGGQPAAAGGPAWLNS